MEIYQNNKSYYQKLKYIQKGGSITKKLNKVKMNDFKKAFDYPFSFIKGGENYHYSDERYLIENFTLTMFNKNLKSEKIDLNLINFPEDIMEVYGYQEGINDEKPWHFVGKIKYKNTHKYIYYIASADYTGFDCQGDMKMYISKSLKRILKYAIEEKTYHNLYFSIMKDNEWDK